MSRYPFVKEFISALDAALKAHRPLGPGLSFAQRSWLGFCLMGILITNTVCRAKFERASSGRYSLAALSWMFRRTKIPRELLLQLSVQTILQRYGISEWCLCVDDSNKGRSKVTEKIAHVHKLKDKAGGGFIRGQNLIFLLLITPKVTIPVGFAFYRPDPALTAWNKENKQLKQAGVPAKERPPKPPRNPSYPTKQALALELLNAVS